MKFTGGRGWLDVQFHPQRLHATLKDAQRAGPVAVSRVQAHECAIGRLAEWVQSQQTFAIADGGPIVPFALQQFNQTGQPVQRQQAQPLPFRQNPVVVTTGQQIASVQSCRLFQCGAC